MNKSSEEATRQVNSAIDNLNWQARSMDENAKQAERSRIESGNQSRGALEATIDASRTDQRAWISVGSIPGRSIEFVVGKYFETGLGAINTGHTPALNTRMQFNAHPMAATAKLRFADLPFSENSSVVAPGGSFAITHGERSHPLDQVSFEKIKSSEWTLYAYGRISYDDVFGFHHWTEFCYTYTPATGGMDYCPFHNDVDKELR